MRGADLEIVQKNLLFLILEYVLLKLYKYFFKILCKLLFSFLQSSQTYKVQGVPKNMGIQ